MGETRHPQRFAFALLLGVLLVRAYPLFLHPFIWAEDGVWIGLTLKHGFAAIFYPDSGYFLVIQKLFTAFVSVWPVALWPVCMTTLCVLTYAAVMSCFARPCYGYILPSHWQRVMICLVFGVLPGTPEILGNAANLGWVLNFYVGLVLIQDPKFQIRWTEILLSMLVILSAGQTLILAPVMIFRLLTQFKSTQIGPSNQFRILTLFLFQICVTGWTYLFVPRPVQPQLDWLIFSLGCIFGTFNGIVLQPIFGSHITSVLGAYLPVTIWICSLQLIVLGVYFFLKSDSKNRLPFVLVASWCLSIPLQGLVREWIRTFYSIFIYPEELAIPQRIGFVLAPAGVLFVVLLLSKIRWKSKALQNYWAFAYVLGYFCLNSAGWTIQPPKGAPNWRDSSNQLQTSIETGCPSQVTVPTSPAGWSLQYESKKHSRCS